MGKDDKRLAPGRRWFEYHCYEGEDSSDAQAWHRTHQQVIVLRKLKDVDPEVGDMYRIQFSDGLEWDVFGDELVKSPKEFYRPDYKPPKRKTTKKKVTKRTKRASMGISSSRR